MMYKICCKTCTVVAFYTVVIKKGSHLFPKETSLGQHSPIACYWIAILCLLAVNINEVQDESAMHTAVPISVEYESSGIYYYFLCLSYKFLSLMMHRLLKFAIKIRRELAATLRWFTAGGALRMALRQLSQTWKLRH